VAVAYLPGSLDVLVWNDGVLANGNGSVRGHGLIGMQERVSLYGGRLEVGSEGGGAYRVHARIPLESGT
jgi:signal transduction histidine kinase